jgi:serine/threonine-protein kinase
VPESDDSDMPFFSDDGKSIGFLTKGRQLKFMSADGGPATTITDSLVGRAGGAWGPDGTMYVDGSGAKPLVKVKAAAGAIPHWFTELDSGEVDHTQPSMLPNGKGVLFTVGYGQQSAAKTGVAYALAVADIATGKHRIILDNVWVGTYAPSGHLIYVTPGGSLMAAPFDLSSMKLKGDPVLLAEGLRTRMIGGVGLGVSRTGTLAYISGATQGIRELVWVTRDGKAQEIDSTWRLMFNNPVLSPDDKKLAVAIWSGARFVLGSDIWVKELDRGPRLKLTFDATTNGYPAWTPDGKKVTYFSNAGGRIDLWTKPADGSSQPVHLLGYSRGLNDALWSRDSRWLVVKTDLQESGTGDILAIRPGVDSNPVPLVATKSMELSPTLSPDARYLAYSSDESGKQEVYVVPFPNSSSAKWAVSTGGGTEPLWSPRGDEIFYRDFAGNMVAASVRTSPSFAIAGSKVLFPASSFVALFRKRQYDVTSDGRRFLMLRPVSSGAAEKIFVFENWAEELDHKK